MIKGEGSSCKVDKICDYDEAFTRQEMFEETRFCLRCRANPKCPMHIKAIEEEYEIKVKETGGGTEK